MFLVHVSWYLKQAWLAGNGNEGCQVRDKVKEVHMQHDQRECMEEAQDARAQRVFESAHQHNTKAANLEEQRRQRARQHNENQRIAIIQKASAQYVCFLCLSVRTHMYHLGLGF